MNIFQKTKGQLCLQSISSHPVKVARSEWPQNERAPQHGHGFLRSARDAGQRPAAAAAAGQAVGGQRLLPLRARLERVQRGRNPTPGRARGRRLCAPGVLQRLHTAKGFYLFFFIFKFEKFME